MKFKTISWRDIEACVETVNRAIRTARFQPDCIVTILKGGLVPARLLSDCLQSIEIYPVRAKAYEGTRKLKRMRLEPFKYTITNRTVLLVDDIHDSGQTLQRVRNELQRLHPRELRSATLYYRDGATHPPDFYGRTVTSPLWLVFPWERHEARAEYGKPGAVPGSKAAR